MDKKKVAEVLKMIAQDAKDDAKKFDGQPFNGRTVAEYFGNHGAAIAALAQVVGLLVDILPEEDDALSVCPDCEIELHLTADGVKVCLNEVCESYRRQFNVKTEQK